MRATDNLEAWNLVLAAMAVGDYDLARNIVIDNEFDMDTVVKNPAGKNQIYTFMAKRKSGEIVLADVKRELEELTGISRMRMDYRFKKADTFELDGWIVSRKLVAE